MKGDVIPFYLCGNFALHRFNLIYDRLIPLGVSLNSTSIAIPLNPGDAFHIRLIQRADPFPLISFNNSGTGKFKLSISRDYVLQEEALFGIHQRVHLGQNYFLHDLVRSKSIAQHRIHMERRHLARMIRL
ncbi:hypothetical protein D3C78_1009050 [compost metagenome]